MTQVRCVAQVQVTPKFVRINLLAAVGVVLLALVANTTASATGGHHNRAAVRVMTQNLYVGADLFKVFEADPNDPFAIALKVGEIYQDTLNADFPARAAAIAQLVADNDPDLIGLQEVSDLLEVDGAFQPVIRFDYLTILTDALADAGLDYVVASTVVNAQLTMPAVVGIAGGGNPIVHFISLTDRDVILARSDVGIANPMSGNYTDVFSIPIAGQAVDFTRGWTAVDATVGGRTYRFVNTHLEVQGGVIPPSSIQADQAQELINLLSLESLPILLVGDFNSSEDDPIGQPYSLLTDAGYMDAWDQPWLQLGPGYTCCQDADLLNEDSVLDERVDLIFVRNDQHMWGVTFFSTLFAAVLGEEPEDKTPSGLWPSDHGGVVAKVKVTACGLGFELALLLPPLMIWRRRRS